MTASLGTAPAPTAGHTVLSATGLVAGYRGWRHRVPVVSTSGLRLGHGQFGCLLGSNGVGKSTLLRTLAGIQPPLNGRVELLGDPLTRLDRLERARRLAVVLTGRTDTGMLTVRDLVALGRYPYTGWDGRLGPSDRVAVAWAVEVTRVGGLVHRRVAELSDGQRQRVMVARALAQRPAVVLLDEPTAFLDAVGRLELFALLRRLATDEGLAVLAATHDLRLALRVADTLWVLDHHGAVHAGSPADIIADGTLAAQFDSSEVVFDPSAGDVVLRR